MGHRAGAGGMAAPSAAEGEDDGTGNGFQTGPPGSKSRACVLEGGGGGGRSVPEEHSVRVEMWTWALAFIPPAMGRASGRTLNGLEGLCGWLP